MEKPTVISLFSGGGGLDLGFEQAGFKTKVCVEIDKYCCATLRRNRRAWKVIERDINSVSSREILDTAGLDVGEATVVMGGSPCQSFSTLGKKKALEDPRGRLIREFIRVVEDTQPTAFVFENVPGLQSILKGKVLKEILAAFNKKVKYTTNHTVLNSADYGVPQARKRLFILGHRNGLKLEFPLQRYFKNGIGGEKWMSVKDTFKKMIEEGWDLNRSDNKVFKHSKEMINKMKLVEPGKNFWSLPLELRPPCWRNGKHLGKDTFGRIEANKPAPTIRTCGYNPTKGRYIHPFENRGLNTLEMAALQTFPKDYIFEGGLVHVGRQIGDAVPPLLAYRIAEHLYLQLKGKSATKQLR